MDEKNALEIQPVGSMDEASALGESGVSLKTASRDGWRIVVCKARVDATSYDMMAAQLKEWQAMGELNLAIDLRATRFMSLQAIRFCVDLANSLREKGGSLALIAPAEKTQRHFEIYGTLKGIQVVRTDAALSSASRQVLSEDL